MSQRVCLILAIVFSVLCFCGVIFVLFSNGQISPGIAVVPMICSLGFVAGYRKGKKHKDKTQTDNKYKYLNLGMAIGLPIGTAGGVSYAIISDSDMGFAIAIGAGIGLLLGIVIGNIIDYQMSSKQ